MNMEYRTEEQWITICENAVNGNWSDAFQNCVDFGFFAQDLINKYEGEECPILDDPTDLAILSQGAERIRGEK